MSQVQNTLLHNYVQPITVVAIAYIAGSKRFIQHFPGASQGGLCLGAVLGAIGALASPKLLRTKKDEPHFYSFSRIAACLSLGTLFAYASVKSLTGRLTLSLPASFNFIGVEIVAAGIFAGMSLLISKPQADEKKPHPISTERDKPKEPPTHTKDGKLLNKKETPPPSPKDTKNHTPPIVEGKDQEVETRPLSDLNKGELEKYTKEHPSLSVEGQFALNQARQAQGLDVVWPQGITQEQLKFASDQDQVALLHQLYKKHPLALEMCEQSLRDSLTKLFLTDATLSKFPSVHKTLIGLSLEQISNLTKEEAQFAFDQMDSDATQTNFEKLLPSKQFAYNIAFEKHGITPFWIDPITPKHVEALPTIPQGVEWMHAKFLKYPVAFACLDEQVHESLLKLFADREVILSPQDLLKNLDEQSIKDLDLAIVSDWHEYFGYELDHWEKQNPEIQTAFLKCFESHKIVIDTDLLPKGASKGNCTIS